MYRYGFELEGFFFEEDGWTGHVITPQKGWTYPLDGFPGLCELRTTGGKTLESAAAELLEAEFRLNRNCVFWNKYEHKFDGQEMAYMRKHFPFHKAQVNVQNIYNKKIRALNGRTLASIQINISNLLAEERTTKEGVYIPARYGLLDVARIVRRLDVAFAADIRRTNRQPGMYAIKDDFRLEYRSLPNSAWSFNHACIRAFLTKIKNAVEGD